MLLIMLLTYELLYRNKTNKPYPCISHKQQRRALKSLTPDQKTMLIDFTDKDCRTVGSFEKSIIKPLIQAGILYRNENIDGVNVYCINKYSRKYLLKHKYLLDRNLS